MIPNWFHNCLICVQYQRACKMVSKSPWQSYRNYSSQRYLSENQPTPGCQLLSILLQWNRLNHSLDLNKELKRNFPPIATRVHQYVFDFQKACFLGKGSLNKLSKWTAIRPIVMPKVYTTIPSHRPPTALLKSIHSSLHCCPYCILVSKGVYLDL